ncbi:hypothetical protein TCAL_15488, partial [Tigriopus californicus]
KNAAYLWSPEIDAEFNRARKILSSPLLVQPFDPSLETHLLTNAAKKHGLGYALIQYDTHTLSRAPVFPADSTENELHLPLNCDIVSYRTTSDPVITFLFSQAKLDDDYQAVISAFRSHSTIDQLSPFHSSRVYKNIWDELFLIDDGNEGYLLTWGDRIVIPHPARFLIVEKLLRTATDDMIKILMRWFEIIGFPETIITDNGPPFREQFTSWALSRGISHKTFSPYFPSSNGLAESAVKNAKMLLESDTDFSPALHEFRCLPRPNSLSPNQLFFLAANPGVCSLLLSLKTFLSIRLFYRIAI